jgi:hypothetical protein
MSLRSCSLIVGLVAMSTALGCAQATRSCRCLAACHHAAVNRIGGALTDRGDGCCSCGECVSAASAPCSLADGGVAAHCNCAACLIGRCELCERPTPGPPPARLQPALPPKFLPVPTRPILSPARPEAPEPSRGDVEAGYRRELTFPGRD